MKDVFPHARDVIQEDNFGIGILSKYPFVTTTVHRQDFSKVPFLVTTVNVDGQSLNFIAAHAFPPITPITKMWRDSYMMQVAEIVGEQKGEIIVCGDFNAAPWTSAFSHFLRSSRLMLMKGRMLISTWPTSFPLMRIPIDHCLASNGIRVLSYQRGQKIGSDHFPLEATVQIPHQRPR